MNIKLSTLAIALGLLAAAPQVYGITNPKGLAEAARKFPRNVPTGLLLMLLGTAWFLYNVYIEPISDFAAYKPHMMVFFAVIGLGTCIFVQDFLAVRGLAIVLLCLGKLMVDTGRPHLAETHWVWMIQGWAYLFVVAGIWLTISPWRLRDFINWATATESRTRNLSFVRLAFCLIVVALGLTVFRKF
ncbi:MAG: hypothetical protein RLY20_3422 [Verrucomicrobiota bacterium]|jgi:hypothetical protein